MKASAVLRILRQLLTRIAQVQTFLILTVLYFIFLPFFALLFKIFKGRRHNNRSMWQSWKFKAETIGDLKEQS